MAVSFTHDSVKRSMLSFGFSHSGRLRSNSSGTNHLSLEMSTNCSPTYSIGLSVNANLPWHFAEHKYINSILLCNTARTRDRVTRSTFCNIYHLQYPYSKVSTIYSGGKCA